MHGSEMFIILVYFIAPIHNISMHLDYRIIIMIAPLHNIPMHLDYRIIIMIAPLHNISTHLDYRIIIIQEFELHCISKLSLVYIAEQVGESI